MILNQALPATQVAHRQACLDAQSPVTSEALAQAVVRNIAHRPQYFTNKVFSRLYSETPERGRWRAFFDAASQLPGAVLAVTFVKDGGEVRTMLCQPLPASEEYTRRYVLVLDLDAQAPRRINLDAIVKLSMESHSDLIVT